VPHNQQKQQNMKSTNIAEQDDAGDYEAID
jgi:hypothetical protein